MKSWQNIQVKSMIEIEQDSDRDYWMRAAEAKDYGLIDEVLRRKVNKC